MAYWNIALVAQGIEQMTSNPQIQVRVLSRVPHGCISLSGRTRYASISCNTGGGPSSNLGATTNKFIMKGETMDNYKYTLQYQCEDTVLTYTFNAETTMEDLKDQLKNFLRGCSWTEAQTAFLEENPEEAARSAIMSEQYDRIDRLIKQARDQEWSAKTILDELERKYIC